MGIFSKSAPKVPNAAETTAEAAKVNAQTAAANQQFQTEAFKTNFGATKNTANPFATSQAIIDPATGMPTGSNVGFSGQWGQGVGSVGDAFAANAGNGLRPTFDTSTINNIMQSGMENFYNLTAPGIEQGQGRINQEIANRGIPINDKIATDLQGNFDQKNNLAAGAFFADLYGKAPGLQSQLDQNQMYQQFAPTQQSLALGTQSMGLLPNTGTPQMGAASQANVDHSGNVWNAYNAEQKAAAEKQAGLNSLLKTGGSMFMNYMLPGSGFFPGGGSAPSGYPQSGIWNSSPTNFNWGQS
jgi:hypothetical protein